MLRGGYSRRRGGGGTRVVKGCWEEGEEDQMTSSIFKNLIICNIHPWKTEQHTYPLNIF